MSNKFQSYDHEVAVFDDIMIPMRDGSRMCAVITFPAKDGKVDFTKKYPVVLNRTGYRATSTLGYGAWPSWCMEEFSTADGYASMVISGRGTYHSEGQMHPLCDEGWGQDGCPDRGGWGVHKDGIDAINWILKQPWCNGQIATYGISWMGASQLLPWLADNKCGISTSFIFAPAVNSGHRDWGYTNGFFTLKLQLIWALQMFKGELERYPLAVVEAIRKEEEIIGKIPELVTEHIAYAEKLVREFVPKYGVLNLPVFRHIRFWRKWVENRENMDFFSYNDTTERPHAFNKPLLFMTGYNDVFTLNAVKAYEQAVKDAPTQEIADGHRLVLSPYNHVGVRMSDNPEYITSTMTDHPSMILSWSDRQLRNIPCEVFDKGKALIFVQGEERWRAEKSWPIADTQYTEFYLHSNGNANTSSGDGVLSTEKPVAEAVDTYKADPANPAPSICDNDLMMGGYGDVSAAEGREDMLVYTTPVLEEDTEITGWVNATLYASTSATDSDFIMRLVDVFPDGKARHLTMGGCRGRYRKDRRAPEAMIPGQIEKLELPMHVTSCMFKKGHRIRVEVISAASPLWDVNPNAFVDLNTCTAKDYVIANQTIYHDAEHPSSITLPIIPTNHEAEWLEWPFEASVTGGVHEGEMMIPGFDVTRLMSKLQKTIIDADELPRVD
ncbi:CocE/NonD family hydrolase [Clostridium sp. Marseille-P2415]|uniref:CocE/NonD family hydrolase n=1 Tax=Clostridium sp. Marseille-P2415 TaxID=1805471 RepID=UPI0009883FFD|nr:CocE/NonD family hydrolase [Clostridium sp. Marseille-P2415]